MPVVSPTDLRRLAEAAAGQDGREGYIDLTPDGHLQVANHSSGASILSLATDPTATQTRPVQIMIGSGEGTTVLGDRHDALWLTKSAVEKFAIPYYAAVRGAKYALSIQEAAETAVRTGRLFLLAHGDYSSQEWIPAEGQISINLGENAAASRPLDPRLDSIFWSKAAIEKFALPYYQRIRGSAFVRQMEATMADPEVLALAHEPPSIPDWIRVRG